jgi:hypothetical protein
MAISQKIMSQKLVRLGLGCAAMVAAATMVAVAPAQAGMDDSYVGGSLGATTDIGLDDVLVGLDGRLKIQGTPLSARATVYPFDGGGVQLTATLDGAIGPTTGAYIGGGVLLDDISSPVVQAGLETKLGSKAVIYGGLDYFTRTETLVGKVGVGFSF